MFCLEQFLELSVVWVCGGGTILIFLLTTVSGIEQHLAQGTNLIFFIPTCLVSIFINWKNKNIQKNTAIIVIISGIIGAIIGAIISIKLDVNMLRKYFGLFLIFIAIYEIYTMISSYIKKKKANNKNV